MTIFILFSFQYIYFYQFEVSSAESGACLRVPVQDPCVGLTDLRNSLRTAAEESTILTSPALSVHKVVKASGNATSDLEDVCKMKKI